MSKSIMTEARVRGVSGGGYMDYGRLSRAEIIKRTRDVARHEVEKWTKVLEAHDAQFDCRIVRGVHKQELIEKLAS